MKWPDALLAALAALVFMPPAAFAAATSDDRIAVSANGSTLTGTNGGGGASLGWLHNFDADTLLGVAVEHETLSSSHWNFGSLNGSLTRGADNFRYGAYAEAHEGAGDDGPHPFHYSIVAGGLSATYLHRLTAQLENRRIDVEKTHGNLPKVALAYLWSPRLLTSFSYAYSVSGNLGTRLATARIDAYGKAVNLFAGVAHGQAAPSVVNLQTGIVFPGRQLKEGYIGISKPLSWRRSEVTLVADYLDLSGIKRATLTVNYIFHVGAAGTGR